MSTLVSAELAHRVEQFVYREAAYLDAWNLDAWIALFTPACAYEVTPPGENDAENLSPDQVYFLIADDRERLEARITRMKSPAAHAEYPRSRTRHLYSNVRVDNAAGDGLIVHANFLTFRNRDRLTLQYMGEIRFDLQLSEGSFLIQRKRVMPDMDALIPQGRVSIFL